MNRTIRGLEDHETQERKRLHRDVRSPSQRLADALKLGQVQIGGMFGAGVCLFLFPVLATPLFLVGIALFLARLRDRRTPAVPYADGPVRYGQRRSPARTGRFCQTGGHFLPRQSTSGQTGALAESQGYSHPLPALRHDRFRQDGNACFPVLQRSGNGKRAVLHRSQGQPQAGCADMADGPIPWLG